MQEDGEGDEESLSSTKSKSRMPDWSSFSNSITKLGSDNVAVARIEAQEKEKDRVAAEALRMNDGVQRRGDRIFQLRQSLDRDVSQLRKDRRQYLVEMNERNEKRRKEGDCSDYASGPDFLKEAIDDINEEIMEKRAAITKMTEEESNFLKTPQKSNVTPRKDN